MRDQVLATIRNKQHTLTIEINSRTRHRALQQLDFAGELAILQEWMRIQQLAMCTRLKSCSDTHLTIQLHVTHLKLYVQLSTASAQPHITLCTACRLHSPVVCAGKHCRHVSHLTVSNHATDRGLPTLQPLQPCLTAQLRVLVLHGMHVAFGGRQASDLVQLLLGHCPHLTVLDLQVGC
jgi:hypothetical protein